MSERITTIQLQKDYLHFSAAHFTIFSSTERENLHGHNFFVEATLEGPIGSEGLCFDYNEVKDRLNALCISLDELVLLPELSPHLKIEHTDDYIYATFNGEKLPFLPRDVKIVPLRNITIEELSCWFLETLISDQGFKALRIYKLKVRVSSGPGQWATSEWSIDNV
ncbi:MAG: 6-carboxytetrahydropterin synthase [Pseudomonadales bacterium]|nr:6-carboxytetrahydropterin synthase [Pseudomonadales bacterium]HAO54248.1 6-pyruvoyl tetrahydropterin synthase [Gammaproteobacteria bacterium]|tara:strand:- start:2776 stop:3273 length:498 start_codon:yes stop_codon:yes gene_type:complete